MATGRTDYLDLALPVQGELSGTWGDTVNNGITKYVDIAVAGALSITSTVTLADTLGDAAASNIGSTTAQYRTLIVPASGPSAPVVITAPSSSRTYHVINRNATYTVQIRAGANSGVTLAAGQSATVAYDPVSADYVLVGPIGPITAITGLTLDSPILNSATFNDGYTEEVYAIPSSTIPALSPTNGSIQTWTLTGNSTPTAGTWASGQSLTLMVDDGTAYTITWTSVAVTWKTDSGTAPVLVTSGYTAIVLWKVGATIFGARVGNA